MMLRSAQDGNRALHDALPCHVDTVTIFHPDAFPGPVSTCCTRMTEIRIGDTAMHDSPSSERTCLVLGAGSGIGAAGAWRLAAAGGQLFLHTRANAEHLE